MSYQVLARKYRPQVFGDVVGQTHVTQTLQNALASGRIHHAYLFTGARGVGKTTVARILAKALNCEKRVAGQGSAKPGREANPEDLRSGMEPCNQCPQCLEILQGKSMDVQEIDGASNTGVDDVREIREQVKYLPARGRCKIYIIDEVHMLSTSAFNALLKTLEEPPPHVVFVFATTEVHKIPATILSRCQRYDFRRIPTPELVASLKKLAALEKIPFEEDAIHLIAHEAQGSLRDAQSLLDQAIAFSGGAVRYEDLKKMFGFLDRAQLWELLKAVLSKDRQTALDRLNAFYQGGSDLNRLAQDLLVSIRNLLLIRALGNVPDWLDLPKEETETLESLSESVSLEECDQLFSIAYRGAEDVARASFPKMVFEVLLVRMTQVSGTVPLEAILEKLERFQAPEKTATEPTSRAGVPLGAETPALNWGGFQGWIQKERPQFASILNHGRLAGLEERAVVLQFEKDSVYGEMLQEEDRKKQVQELFQKFFGKPLTLQVVFAEGAASAPASDEAVQKKVLREQALKSDAVREAANILGAVVEEVHVESD